MKKFYVSHTLLIILVLCLTTIFGCSDNGDITGDNGDNGGDGDGNGGLNDTRDAYETVLDFAVAKQIMLYDYLEIMTDNYTSDFMENEVNTGG